MITSGITSGELTMPANRVRPGKRLNRFKASAASVPRTTDAQAVRKAISSDNLKPAMISTSFASAPYQRSDQPPQLVTIGLPLKLSTISVTIGMYKKTKTALIQTRDVTRPALIFMCDPPSHSRPGTC